MPLNVMIVGYYAATDIKQSEVMDSITIIKRDRHNVICLTCHLPM